MDLIKFKVNGVEQTVGSEMSSHVMLLDYIRNYLQLRGTKYMCREGGCGACMVTVSKKPGAPRVAVNSCLVSIGSCHGWDITTIEGLGNKKDGYHIIQKTLAENNATQCGYCTPGWVMTMHGLLESKKELTMLEIEKSVSSNLCRCTGYRPILDALKKFAKDAPVEEKIKEMNICNKSGGCCQSSGDKEDGWCMVRQDDWQDENMAKIILKDGKTWYRPTKLEHVLALLEENSESYMLVAGNSSKGAYPIDDYPDNLIDVSCLQELRSNELDQNLIVGAGLTMSEFNDVLKAAAQNESFGYLTKLYEHIELVAHIPLRNTATIAGNLMIKHTYNEYPSDIYLLFDTVGAQLTIVDFHGVEEVVTMENFLKISMKWKVIVNVLLPPLTKCHQLYTYKLMPRAQSTHAIVNCGFLFQLNSSNIVKDARIRYGGLSSKFERATATEKYLYGKPLFDNDTLQGALRVLDGEMIVEPHAPNPPVEARRYMAKALFFKGLLTLCPSRGARFNSAIVDLHQSRPCSSGKQTFTTDTSLWPLSQPIHKLEAMIQCSGEAKYTDDIPLQRDEVFGAFVLSTVALGTIIKMDPSEALAIPGVHAFYTAKDIPGLNSFTPADGAFTTANEEVLCEGTVRYYNQPIGIIVADSQHVADRASKLVKVKYADIKTPVVDLKVAKEDSTRNSLFASADATSTGTDVYKTITGRNILHGQYHFPMETIQCVARPTEEGLEVHMPTQWLDGSQLMISRALNIDQNKIDLYVNRVGGSYGLKITRSIQAAIACCLIAIKRNSPCRFIQPLITNLTAVGKRMPSLYEYEVGVNSSGEIQYVNSTMYTDNGYKVNEPVPVYGFDVYYNCYDAAKFSFKSYNTVTDTPKNTFARSPGTAETVAAVENVLERIAYELSLDPIAVRLANLDKTHYNVMVELLESLKTSAEFTARRAAVDSFNTENRWKKRGLRFSFSRWPTVGSLYVDVNMAVYYGDCTVSITHGGVEMGQGINTKVAQVAAHFLGIPVEKIQIKSNNTIISPNTFPTSGSVSMDNIIIALRRCIEQLQARLEPVKATMTDPTWEQLIKAAYASNVDLQVHGHVGFADSKPYEIYGIACAEVEVDVLTGEFEIRRVDLIQDVGFSISPEIDIGQIEGAFMMGVGYWTCEKLIYDQETGRLLTDRSWDYHLPEARDTPRDFIINLKNSHSNDLILGSKGVGEPSVCLAVCVAFAVREAVAQARQESGIPTTEWFEIEGPFSTDKVCMAMKTDTKDFKFE